MVESDVKVVLVPGAWADGSSWSKVVTGLHENGVGAVTVPVPLTTLDDDVAALDRTLERIDGPVVLVGHAYAGAVIGAARSPRIKALVYIAALSPDEGETVADVFHRNEPHPTAPKLAPDKHGDLVAPGGVCRGLCPKRIGARSGGIGSSSAPDFAGLYQRSSRTAALEGGAELVSAGGAGSNDSG